MKEKKQSLKTAGYISFRARKVSHGGKLWNQ